MNFFYDEQIRKYLSQFMRILGGFSVKTGKDRNGNEQFIQVPIRYGDVNRMAAHIIKNQSENTINSVPFISCYITDLQMNAERRMNPTHVDKTRVYEKKFDTVTGQYLEDEIGNTYLIEKYMPVPYDLSVQVDCWTSNTDQRFQLMEQLLVLFNPSVNLKTNDNPLDWSNLTYIELVNVIWNLRQVPQGTDDVIDVTALNFTLPILINPPAKVKRQTLIHTILTEIKRKKDDEIFDWIPPDPIPYKEWVVVTLDNLKLRVQISGNKAILLNRHGGNKDDSGNLLDWNEVLRPYGEIRYGISEVRLRRGLDPSDDGDDIVAAITDLESDPSKSNIAYIDIDSSTLPSVTIPAISAVIDPTKVGPGMSLPAAATGQRYLIIKDAPSGALWGNITAFTNDIIQYNGTNWVVSFSASSNNNAVVLNTSNALVYEWRNGQWINAVEGTYTAGWWRLRL